MFSHSEKDLKKYFNQRNLLNDCNISPNSIKAKKNNFQSKRKKKLCQSIFLIPKGHSIKLHKTLNANEGTLVQFMMRPFRYFIVKKKNLKSIVGISI